MKLSTLALWVSTAAAFSDTAAFYASGGLDARSLKYVSPSTDLASAISEFTSEFCSVNTDDKLYLYRVKKLERAAPMAKLDGQTYVKHVQYHSGSDVDMAMAESCVVQYLNAKPTNAADLTANVIVVDIEDDNSHSIDEFLGEKYVFVQGKPRFESSGESIKEYLKEKLNGLEELTKRSADPTEDDVEDDEAILQEVESDFRTAEAMIAAQESDAMVTALSDDHTLGASASKNGTSTKSNLFTNYQFFTPGVWSALIVSFFLLYVASTAISWITSIELSYKSFVKQVEYEKKTE